MFAEYDVVLHVNDVHRVFLVVFLQVFQNLKLDTSLVVIFFLVLDDLQGNLFLVKVVKSLNCNSEAPFSEKAKNLVSEGDMIFNSDAVVAFAVVEPKVVVLFIVAVGRSMRQISTRPRVLGSDFFDTLAEVVNVGVVQDLCPFIVSEMVAELFQAFSWRHRTVYVMDHDFSF